MTGRTQKMLEPPPVEVCPRCGGQTCAAGDQAEIAFGQCLECGFLPVRVLPRRLISDNWIIALFGVALMIGAILPHAAAWRSILRVREAQQWEPGLARLTELALRTTRTSDATFHELDLAYEYVYRGQTYTGSRLLLNDADSTIQKHAAAVLEPAFQRGGGVPCYINPTAPREAVLSPRLDPLGFHLLASLPPLLVVLAVASLGFFWHLESQVRALSRGAREQPLQPWRWLKQWRGSCIVTSDSLETRLGVLGSTCCLALCAPGLLAIGIDALYEIAESGFRTQFATMQWITWVVAGFGVLLLSVSVLSLVSGTEKAENRVILDHFPILIGETGTGEIHLHQKLNTLEEAEISLRCATSGLYAALPVFPTESYAVKPGLLESRSDTLVSRCPSTPVVRHDGTHFPFQLPVPAPNPESIAAGTEPGVSWSIQLKYGSGLSTAHKNWPAPVFYPRDANGFRVIGPASTPVTGSNELREEREAEEQEVSEKRGAAVAFWLCVITTGLCLLVPAPLFAIGFQRDSARVAQQAQWPAVEATVLKADLGPAHDSPNIFVPQIQYSYQVDGLGVKNDRLGSWPTLLGPLARDHFLATIQQGARLKAFVDPSNPENSVLVRATESVSPLMTTVGSSLLLFSFSLMMWCTYPMARRYPDEETKKRVATWWTMIGVQGLVLSALGAVVCMALPSLHSPRCSPSLIATAALLGALGVLIHLGLGIGLLIATAFRPPRRRWLVFLLVWAALLAGGMQGGKRLLAGTILPLKQAHPHGVALVDAVKQFEAEHQKPPEHLPELVPKYLEAIPETGIPACPEFYYFQPQDPETYGGSCWVLFVSIPPFDMVHSLVYYEALDYGDEEVLAKRGDWRIVSYDLGIDLGD